MMSLFMEVSHCWVKHTLHYSIFSKSASWTSWAIVWQRSSCILSSISSLVARVSPLAEWSLPCQFLAKSFQYLSPLGCLPHSGPSSHFASGTVPQFPAEDHPFPSILPWTFGNILSALLHFSSVSAWHYHAFMTSASGIWIVTAGSSQMLCISSSF